MTLIVLHTACLKVLRNCGQGGSEASQVCGSSWGVTCICWLQHLPRVQPAGWPMAQPAVHFLFLQTSSSRGQGGVVRRRAHNPLVGLAGAQSGLSSGCNEGLGHVLIVCRACWLCISSGMRLVGQGL